MKIEHFEHENVNQDGTINDGGAVYSNGAVTFSNYESGCGLSHCNCSEGHWICTVAPRDNETLIVSGVTIRFGNKAEMIHYIDEFISEASNHINKCKKNGK